MPEGRRWLGLALDSGAGSEEARFAVQVRWLVLSPIGSGSLAELDDVIERLPTGVDSVDLSLLLAQRTAILGATHAPAPLVMQVARQSIEVAERAGLATAQALALTEYGYYLAEIMHDLDGARRALGEATALAVAAGGETVADVARHQLAWVEILGGNFEVAEAISRSLVSDTAFSRPVSEFHLNLGWALLGQDRVVEAVAEFADAARGAYELGDAQVLTESTVGLACAATASGNRDAGPCLDLATALFRTHGRELSEYVAIRLKTLQAARGKSSPEVEPATLDPREVIAQVLADEHLSRVAASPAI